MKQNTTRAVAFLTSAMAGIALGAATGASADVLWFKRVHAADCLTVGGTPVYGDFALQNDSDSSPLTVLCAADDTETHPKHETTQLHVHGYDGSSTAIFTAQACQTYWFVGGGECDVPATNGLPLAVGQVNNHLEFEEVWNTDIDTDNEHNFGYVVVSVPPKLGSSLSSLRGLWQASTTP